MKLVRNPNQIEQDRKMKEALTIQAGRDKTRIQSMVGRLPTPIRRCDIEVLPDS
jgi:hypothetical protein